MLTSKHRMLLALSGLALLFCLWFLFNWIGFLRKPIVSAEQGVKYTVAEGTSIKAVTRDLYLLNIIKHPTFFKLLIYLKGDKHDLKAGEYLFPKGTTPISLLTQITTGSGMVYHSFTIVAGWSFKHLRNELMRDASLQHTSATLSDEALMQRLGHPELKPEGQFYPDTYFFVKGSSDLILLKRAFKMMQTKANAAWSKREANLPYQTINEALTAASLVEKETGIDLERPVIAGVIVNRLRKNMRLQIDPTVIYAAGAHFDGTIHRADLLSHNPYNTYMHTGLPPTPIAIPGMASIEAVLHPQHNNYYYFVAKNYNPDGRHQFSTTWTEHEKAVATAKQRRSHGEYFNDVLIRSYFLKWLTFLWLKIF